jgi:hypothetical protein
MCFGIVWFPAVVAICSQSAALSPTSLNQPVKKPNRPQPTPTDPNRQPNRRPDQAAPRVLFMRAFSHLFDARPSGLNPLTVLRGAPEFVATRQRINEAVAGEGCVLNWASGLLEEREGLFIELTGWRGMFQR